jgi:hypothetical protein
MLIFSKERKFFDENSELKDEIEGRVKMKFCKLGTGKSIRRTALKSIISKSFFLAGNTKKGLRK